MFRLCAAGFSLLLVFVSLLAVGRWYWYGDVGDETQALVCITADNRHGSGQG